MTFGTCETQPAMTTIEYDVGIFVNQYFKNAFVSGAQPTCQHTVSGKGERFPGDGFRCNEDLFARRLVRRRLKNPREGEREYF